MSNFQLDPKRVVINSPEQHELEYFNLIANGSWEKVTLPDDQPTAKVLVISGFAKLFSNQVTRAIGRKGIASLPQISTLTLTTAFITAIGVGNELTLKLRFRSSNLESENANWDGRFGRPRTFPFIINVGETVTTLATRIRQVLDEDKNLTQMYLSSITNSEGVITFATKRGGLELVAFFEETATGVTSAIIQPAFGGRGSFEVMKNIRIETPARVYEYSADTAQLPIKGILYSSYELYQTVQRPDLSNASVANGGPISGSYGFELFINQTSCPALIADLTKWINANVAGREMYTATTPIDTLNEAAVVTAVVDVTPFTIGLF